jgi:hypothetical protein
MQDHSRICDKYKNDEPLPLSRATIREMEWLGRLEQEILDMLAGFYLFLDDLNEQRANNGEL